MYDFSGLASKEKLKDLKILSDGFIEIKVSINKINNKILIFFLKKKINKIVNIK